MTRTMNKYTPEMKQECVERVLSGQTLGVVSEEFNVPVATLNSWMAKQKKQGPSEERMSKLDNKYFRLLEEEREVEVSGRSKTLNLGKEKELARIV